MNERGTVTIWLLGCTLMILAVGGLAVDLWRTLDARRELAALADSAAAAAAGALDVEAAHRGELVLDPARAEAYAAGVLAAHPRVSALDAVRIEVSGASVRVALAEQVDFALVDLLGVPDVTVTVDATAEPRRGG